jgi:hypothetical protein
LPFAWAEIPKTSFRKNRESPIQNSKKKPGFITCISYSGKV